MPPNIVIVGAGSLAWAPQLVRDILTTPALEGSTLVFYDRGSPGTEAVHTLAQRLLDERRRPYRLDRRRNLDQALEGADFVVAAIGVGGVRAVAADLEVCARHGIHHSVGDTTGPAGLARALRTIPVFVDLARRIEAQCPEAWLLNLSNPMSAVCRAVTRETSVKTIGLCHEVPRTLATVRRLLGLPEASAIQYRVAGINHLPWLLELAVDGQDAFPQLAERLRQISAQAGPVAGLDLTDTTSKADRWLLKARLFEIYGALPAAGDRHLAEFFPLILGEATGMGARYGIRLTDIEERRSWRDQDQAFIKRLLAAPEERRAFLKATSGEAVAPIIAALTMRKSFTGVFDLPNRGQVANLPSGMVVETQGRISAAEAAGLPAGDLPPGIQAVVARHIANQEMIVEAALTGDRRLALQALANDPLVTDLDSLKSLLGELLAAGREYLPKVWED
jgi:alpha-galactosidase